MDISESLPNLEGLAYHLKVLTPRTDPAGTVKSEEE